MPTSRERISRGEACRIAIAAQGFREPRPDEPSQRHIDRVLSRLGQLQIDSVNVLARAHYVPLFSRLGAYDMGLLDAAAYGRKRRRLFEYWGHEASLLRMDLHPLMRWRMARAERGEGMYSGLAKFGAERRDFIEAVEREVAARGPLTARELSNGGKASGSWWGWSDGKRALEWLFWAGRVTTAARRGFERVYDLPERVLPATIVNTPAPSAADAQRELLRVAARALGIATERCLRDYFRLNPEDARPRIAELVEAGELVPVSVQGWSENAFVDPQIRIPRKVEAQALVSPFDPLVWERTRTERLFDFRYRIEIYTPADQREYGYYCLPFLLGDRFAGRVDLKADRQTSRLIVQSIHAEAGIDRDLFGSALAAELRHTARWLGLADIVTPAPWAPALGL